YVLQDDFFHIVRQPSMPLTALAAQLARTAERVLLDLPYTHLAVDELGAILGAIGAMALFFGRAREPALSHGGPAPHDAFKGGLRGGAAARTCERGEADEQGGLAESPSFKDFWAARRGDETARGVQVAHYRWITGHHLLNLCFIFCRKSLGDAVAALRD